MKSDWLNSIPQSWNELLRTQYHTRIVGLDTHTWDVHGLVQRSRGLPVISVPLSDIAEIKERWWYQDESDVPTPQSIADHMALVQQADLTYPIILCSDGRLMDGMHRVVKALLQERQSIDAVRFDRTPDPDHINVDVATLPYPDIDI